MDRDGVVGSVRGRSARKVALASLAGTTIEWYDFFIYGTAAALIFNQLFFPTFDPLVGTLAAFSTFAVAFLARPLGGVIFGHYGDRVGRKPMLVISLVGMGLATFAVGLLPSYDRIGVIAPILLVALRFLQGFAVGGEWGAAVLIAAEHAPENKRGFYASIPQMGVPAGILASNLVFLTVAATLPEAQFAAWGWRVPFLLSAVLVGVGLYIQLRIIESPAFSRVKETHTEARAPIRDVIKTHPKQVLLATGASVAGVGANYILVAFLLTYATSEVGVGRGTILAVVMLSSVVSLLAIPIAGALSDRVGRKPLFLAGTAGIALTAFPLFWLVDSGVFVLMLLGHLLAYTSVFVAYGVQSSFLSELFGTRVRYSGASLGYQLGGVLGGGFAPVIATALLAFSGGRPWPMALYLVALALVTLVSVYLAPETRRCGISEDTEVTARGALSELKRDSTSQGGVPRGGL